jgi:uncharacterized protein DUF3565
VKRQIKGFETDEHGHWRAALVCGHFQHVRHDPPLTKRDWVLTQEGRTSRIGFELDCKRCDEEAENESLRASDYELPWPSLNKDEERQD